MTPSDLSNLYQTLRTRVSIYCPDGCVEISPAVAIRFWR